MTVRRHRQLTALVLLAALSLVSACGNDDEATVQATEPNPSATTAVAVPTGTPPAPDPTEEITVEPEQVDEIVDEVLEDENLEEVAGLDQAVASAKINSARLIVPQDAQNAGTMDAFLSAVIHDIDRYWQATFAAEDLPAPSVFYAWPAKGETMDSGCNELTDDETAMYCGPSDTIFVSQDFAIRLWDGLINTTYGPQQSDSLGDFAVAYVLAHEFGHSIQAELGVLGVGYPVWRTELQADCFAGNWANSAYLEGILEDGDIEEALTTADLVGDFEFASEQHHGTPDERVEAFTLGWTTGDPVDCFVYLDES
jgi:predicted metalloprotease